jgi:hypothetical protein
MQGRQRCSSSAEGHRESRAASPLRQQRGGNPGKPTRRPRRKRSRGLLPHPLGRATQACSRRRRTRLPLWWPPALHRTDPRARGRTGDPRERAPTEPPAPPRARPRPRRLGLVNHRREALDASTHPAHRRWSGRGGPPFGLAQRSGPQAGSHTGRSVKSSTTRPARRMR